MNEAPLPTWTYDFFQGMRTMYQELSGTSTLDALQAAAGSEIPRGRHDRGLHVGALAGAEDQGADDRDFDARALRAGEGQLHAVLRRQAPA
jgi:hypothetical protein